MSIQQLAERLDSIVRTLDMAELIALQIFDHPGQADENMSRTVQLQKCLLRAKNELCEFGKATPEEMKDAADHLRHVAHLGSTKE